MDCVIKYKSNFSNIWNVSFLLLNFKTNVVNTIMPWYGLKNAPIYKNISKEIIEGWVDKCMSSY